MEAQSLYESYLSIYSNSENSSILNEEQELPKQTDLYDIILSHLLDEGYAETSEAAEKIMVNMSEEWREEILNEARYESEMSDKQKRRVRRSRLPYDGGKGNRAETIRQKEHQSSRGRRGNEGVAASSGRYEEQPGRKIKGKGYVSYEKDEPVSGTRRGAESPTDR